MCYQERYFTRRADKQARKREEPKPVEERIPASTTSAAPPRAPHTSKPKESERELEVV